MRILDLDIPPEHRAPFAVLDALDLVETDGVPLESHWHVLQIDLLLETVTAHMGDRQDYYAAGNMFIYFSVEQARNKDYRGPDFFFVDKVPREPMRPYWAVWEQQGRYPDVVVELLSPTTAKGDLTTKKDIYENIFRTHEYFCFDPDHGTLQGWRLVDRVYQKIQPDDQGRLPCEKIGVAFGKWRGEYMGYEMDWYRPFTAAGIVVPTAREKLAAEQRRADSAVQEVARLKELLRQEQSKNQGGATT